MNDYIYPEDVERTAGTVLSIRLGRGEFLETTVRELGVGVGEYRSGSRRESPAALPWDVVIGSGSSRLDGDRGRMSSWLFLGGDEGAPLH